MLTKDGDFVELVQRAGPPPQVLWLRCGNTSNATLRALLQREWSRIAGLLAAGEALIEISDRAS